VAGAGKQREMLCVRCRTSPLRPIGAVQSAVLNGFAEVPRFHILRAVQIGNGASDFQDAVMRARRKAHAGDRILQHLFAVFADRAEFADQLGRHLRVGKYFPLPGIASGLALAGAHHAFADRGGVFGRAAAAQLLVLHRGHLDVNIDAVDQRAGNF